MNIWTNGCFDVLHVGHLNLFEFAKNFKGRKNMLYVGIDTDRRVQESKGKGRPINSQEDRKRMLEALKVVDEVFIFDSDEQLAELIKTCDIDYMIIGEDYMNKRVVGRENSRYDVYFFPKDSNSTTNIFEKIMNEHKSSTINLVKFKIHHNNEEITMIAYSYDIMTNMIMFGTYKSTPRFYEHEVLKYIESRFQGGIALDIGANIGNHSIYFSKFIFNKTFAFEANRGNCDILLQNKRLNNIDDDKLIICNEALSDGNYPYQSVEYQENMGGCKVIEGEGNLMTKRLDEFDLPKINFIKIDVEGHELKVLRGAVDLINRDFPDIIIECNRFPESDFDIIDSFMGELNYRLIESFPVDKLYYFKHK